jgi:vanillate O-demethylase ferredoxin subunit
MNASTLLVRVQRKTQEAVGICTLELASVDGHPLPAFSAGSHIDVQLPGGFTRQYSLCNRAEETHSYLIGVLHDENGRGGSRAVHEQVHTGNVLTISMPRNHFPLAAEAEKSVLFAGGIGITPILGMAERLASLEHPFAMHYYARSRERAAFVERIQTSTFAPNVSFHFDNADTSQKLDARAVLDDPTPGVHIYVCGPKGFMDAVLGAARTGGWPEAQLHREYFGGDPASNESDGSFEVQIASSGAILTVPKGRSVVHALAEAGISVPTSCEQGVCGTCLTRVLKGEPDHRDLYLTPEEQARNDQFLPCCSRARSPRLVLDL